MSGGPNGAVNLDADTTGYNLSHDLNHQVGSAAVVFGFGVATPKHSFFAAVCGQGFGTLRFC
jgi:hypothetical protein